MREVVIFGCDSNYMYVTKISDLTGWISVSILASSIFIASVFVAKAAWDDDNVPLCAGSVIFTIISFAVTIYCIYQVLLTGGCFMIINFILFVVVVGCMFYYLNRME